MKILLLGASGLVGKNVLAHALAHHEITSVVAPTRRELIGLAAAACLRRPARAANRPKNVLLIMSDQHKRDCLGAAGDPVARTPNLDAFARSSVRFANAYCSNPVCTPSRALSTFGPSP